MARKGTKRTPTAVRNSGLKHSSGPPPTSSGQHGAVRLQACCPRSDLLKYISDAFEAKREALLQDDWPTPKTRKSTWRKTSSGCPRRARWSLQDSAKQPTIGKTIDDAMLAIEASNASLKGVLPKDYARPALNKVMLGELIDLVSGIAMNEEIDRSMTFSAASMNISSATGAEGKRGGVLHPALGSSSSGEMLEPYKGRIYDPCCGSGGMFVQSRSSSKSMAAGSATLPSTDRRATTQLGGWPK